jgi:hypothetical protein
MVSNVPPWLPSVLGVTAFLTIGFLIGLHPSIRNRYRARPMPGQPNVFQARPRGPGVVRTAVGGLLHYKPMMGAWIGVVSWCVLLALVAVQMPLPIAIAMTPATVVVAVLAYLRPKGAVQSCYIDQNGAITLIRRDVAVPFDLNHYRWVRMYSTRNKMIYVIPSMLVMLRDRRPGLFTRLASMFFPSVDNERVVLFFNRWWDADGYFIGPNDLAGVFYQACARAGHTPKIKPGIFRAPDWEAGPEA